MRVETGIINWWVYGLSSCWIYNVVKTVWWLL